MYFVEQALIFLFKSVFWLFLAVNLQLDRINAINNVAQ